MWSLVHCNTQDPAILHRQFPSAASHHRPHSLKGQPDLKTKKEELFPWGEILTFGATTDRNYHEAVTHTWHTQSQVPLPQCKPDHASSVGPPPPQGPHIKHSMTIKRFINQRVKSQLDQARRVLRVSRAHPQAWDCQDSSHGTMCSISFHKYKHADQTPLKVSKYWNSHGTLKTGRTKDLFCKWSLKSVYCRYLHTY